MPRIHCVLTSLVVGVALSNGLSADDGSRCGISHAAEFGLDVKIQLTDFQLAADTKEELLPRLAAGDPAGEPTEIKPQSRKAISNSVSILPRPVLSHRANPSVDTPLSPPPLPRPGHAQIVEHLRQAVEHLRQAGLDDEAERLQKRADALHERRTAELQEKKRQLQQLLCEIAELECETGLGAAYEVTCLIGEVPLAQARELGLTRDVAAPDPSAAAGSLEPAAVFARTQSLNSRSFRSMVAAGKEAGSLKVLAEPRLIVQAGRPASLRSGGEFPVVVRTAGGGKQIEWREFGTRLETVVVPLAGNRVRLDVRPEILERDFARVAQTEGVAIPAVAGLRLNTQAELSLDDTLVIAIDNDTQAADGGTATFVAITVTAVSGAGMERTASLEPIPDPTGIVNLVPAGDDAVPEAAAGFSDKTLNAPREAKADSDRALR